MEITQLLDRLCDVTPIGALKLKNLSLEHYREMDNWVLWRTERGKLLLVKDVTFGEQRFDGKGRKDSSLSFTGLEMFDYELKSLALVYYKLGFMEGDYGSKWSTTVGSMFIFKRLALFLAGKNYNSFRQLDLIHPIIQRKLFDSFLVTNAAGQGIDVLNIPSSKSSILLAIPMLHRYGLVSDSTTSCFYDAVEALPCIGTSEYSQSHPVIPTAVLKMVLQLSKSLIDEADRSLLEWEVTNERFLTLLKERKLKFAEKTLNKTSRVVARYFSRTREVDKAIITELTSMNEVFKGLRVAVQVQLFAFTGMRNSEAGELKNDAAIRRDDLFCIQSILSKTVEGKQTMNWVANSDTFDAVNILARYNKSMYARVKVILDHHRDELSKELIYHLEDGMKQNKLFGAIPSACSVRFTDRTGIRAGNARRELTGKEGTFNFDDYQFKLTERDIQQLDGLNCNYKGMQGKERRTSYQVGDIFLLTPHQFRHTFAWFIIANRLGDLDDIKYQFKHLSAAMTMTYGQRGFETIEDLLNIIDGFDAQLTEKLAIELSSKAQVRRLSGGGGQRWVKDSEVLEIEIVNLEATNDNSTSFTQKKSLHFKDVVQYKAFLAKNLRGVRGLPHGLCTGGEDCKIKNAGVPTGCVMCGNYIVSERHLPHWRAMEEWALNKLDIYKQATPDQQVAFELMAQSWRTTAAAARMIIDQVKTGNEKLAKEFTHEYQ